MDTDTPAEAAERAAGLVKRMTLEEKCAQLVSLWRGVEADAGDMAPHQSEQASAISEEQAIAHGLGQLTRPFGSAPIDPAAGVAKLVAMQERITANSRFGIPALVHEECLTGFMTLGATVFPTPLAWGATFDPDLLYRAAELIGRTMRSVGVHQGLAPVLDVVFDTRWGRTEESISEDPYLVGTIGSAYVAGLQAGGVVATLKHFAGYSASHAARNFGPVAMGPRQIAETVLPPFEMAVRLGRAGSVMQSYTAIDGVPTAADASLLTGVLRDQWGFDGTVVSDYFGVNFLQSLHGVVADKSGAAVAALAAGVDVELPEGDCYAEPLRRAVAEGRLDEGIVDRAAERVLTQKIAIGLLDGPATAVGEPDFDPPEARELAAEIARRSIVLLANDGILPLGRPARLALVGPVAESRAVMLGCYAFPNHHGHPDGDDESGASASEPEGGVAITTLAAGLRAELEGTEITYAAGGSVLDATDADIAAAVEAAEAAEVAIVAVGDRSGLFGRGTSGEGCDASSHALPGRQAELLEAVLATGTPTVVVVISGRPYALGDDAFDRAAAVVQAFLPGQEGGTAVAQVLSGASDPEGRLPVGVPARPDSPPATYLSPQLARKSEVSSVDPTARFSFGYGLSYTTFEWGEPELRSDAEVGPEGVVEVAVTVRNTGERSGAEVVQLYLHDPVASTVRPVQRLVGYAKLRLAPGEAAEARFAVPVDLAALVGIDGEWIVEAGDLELRLGRSAEDVIGTLRVAVTEPGRIEVGARRLETQVTVASKGELRNNENAYLLISQRSQRVLPLPGRHCRDRRHRQRPRR